MRTVNFRLSRPIKVFATIILIWLSWVLLFRFVFPELVSLFAGVGIEIPLPTRIVVVLDRSLGPIGGAMAVVAALVAVLVVRHKRARSGGRA